jgi:predicted nucleic acid-binding Zn ribbon protein
MNKCEVRNCQLSKRRSAAFFHSPRCPDQLELWKTLLGINKENFYICDGHFEPNFIKVKKLGITGGAYPTIHLNNIPKGSEEYCQCCLIALKNNLTKHVKDFLQISESFQQIFTEVMGCEIKQGLICAKCHKCVNGFHRFRNKHSAHLKHPEILSTSSYEEDPDVKIKEEHAGDDLVIREIKTEPDDTKHSVILESSSVSKENAKEQLRQVWDVLSNSTPGTASSPYTSMNSVKKRKKRAIDLTDPLAEIKNFKCQYCAERFTDTSALLPHIQENHYFECETCGVTFPYEISLIQHKSEHTNRNAQTGRSPVSYIYRCSTCTFKFATIESLTTHMKTKHDTIIEENESKKSKIVSILVLVVPKL